MTDRNPFTYVVLRYTPDLVTSEFLNVGLIFHSAADNSLHFRTRKTFTRLKGAFPHFSKSAFRAVMEAVDRALDQEKRELHRSLFINTARISSLSGNESDTPNAGMIAARVLLVDECLHASEVGSGSAQDTKAIFERFFERLVTAHDSHNPIRKTEDDVWKPVRQRLEERHLAAKLQQKKISGLVDEITFRHAWKNGEWHAYEPLSFDLSDDESIRHKARRWRGQLDAVAEGGAEQFKAHFIAGAPTKPELIPAYRSALQILAGARQQPAIYEEADVETLVEKIEEDIRSHPQSIFD
jgi:hypothetical protein